MRRFIFILFLFTVITGFANAQSEYQKDFQEIKSRYNYMIYRPSVVDFNYFLDYSGAAMDQVFNLAVSIQNDFLQFNKDGNKFISKYDISLIIRRNEETWFSKSWQNESELSSFEQTNSRRSYQYNSYKVNFRKTGLHELESGEYEVLIEIQDKLSSRVYKNKRKLVYKNEIKNSDFGHTEITFLMNDTIDYSKALNISGTRNVFDFNTPYSAFASLFTKPAEDIETNIRIYKKDKEEKSLFRQDFYESQSDSTGKSFIKYPLPYKTMEEGKYSIRFSVSLPDTLFEFERDFSILWYLKPLYLYKIDLAVRPLKYLLNPKQMEKVKNLEENELTVWFNNFWKERDPDTLTVMNELQEVFYRRVTETVRSFSTRFLEGWQTDRGMVYLLYGEPTKVENRKYSVNSLPHIIWKYNYEDSEREFIFVDKSKTGDFVLVDNEN